MLVAASSGERERTKSRGGMGKKKKRGKKGEKRKKREKEIKKISPNFQVLKFFYKF